MFPAQERGDKMDVIKQSLITRYEKLAYTNNYIYGFAFKGLVYYYTAVGIDESCVVLDKASDRNGNGYCIKYKPHKAEKIVIVNSGIAKVLCSKLQFETMVSSSKYNRGDVFEMLITEEKALQSWRKDNELFSEKPDVVINGIAYQIKFEKATYAAETTLNRLERK